MKYVSKEDLQKDSRFFIDERNLDRLTKKKIIGFKVKHKKIGLLLRNRANTNRIVTLDQTRVYAYLKGTPQGSKEYDDYVDICNVPFRSRTAYDSLIVEMEKMPYDIKRGAIVIDQDDLICDGQHRSCFLLYRYGPNYKVDVLQLIYEPNKGLRRIVLAAKVVMAKFRALIICLMGKN